jgi:hypothetical protein
MRELLREWSILDRQLRDSKLPRSKREQLIRRKAEIGQKITELE